MSKSRQKTLAFTLLCLLIGVVHFFFGRAILSAVFYVIEIGLFWIIGAVIALLCVGALFSLIFSEDALDKAEKWIDKKLGFECDDDDDDEIECHIEFRRKNKECACKSENTECKCEDEDVDDEEDVCDYPYCDECTRECELNEDPDAVEEEVADTAEEASSDDEK